MGFQLIVSVFLLFHEIHTCVSYSSPSVVMDVIVRNNADSLPYHLYYLQQLDYPKDKLYVRIHVLDHTNRTSDTALAWERTMKQEYRELTVTFEQVDASSSHQSREEWKETEFRVWRARQNSLDAARAQGINFIFLLDADTILEDPRVLSHLVAENQPILAPLLTETDDFPQNIMSNFNEGESEQYAGVMNGTLVGRLKVDNVHWAVLLALDQRTELIQFETNNRLITLQVLQAAAAKIRAPIQLLTSSRGAYGSAPCGHIDGVGKSFTHILMDQPHLKRLPYIDEALPATDNMGFDAVYVINLARRTDRRMKMERDLRLLGIKARFFQAIDGWTLSNELLEKMNIHQLPGYLDPLRKRTMKRGEIGCFLSHYNIWRDAEMNNYNKVLVLEDDARFRPHFKLTTRHILHDADKHADGWDLMYLGRKVNIISKALSDGAERRHNSWNEYYVSDSDILVYPHYSYFTIAYALSRSGVEKLLYGEPLKKMLPVDEYFCLLFEQSALEEHIMEQYSDHPKMTALSVHPSIIRPTYYLGEDEYVSDTEVNFLKRNGTGPIDIKEYRAHEEL